ncbi:hypothetical protein RCH17_002721 [Arthrobacter sp. MP_M7]|nr:hypothetical protein [Arthrobacter sp. MP_M4]MEC5203905.1 hypothetical protein [Arthrobacter sp. MP_M7]
MAHGLAARRSNLEIPGLAESGPAVLSDNNASRTAVLYVDLDDFKVINMLPPAVLQPTHPEHQIRGGSVHNVHMKKEPKSP